MSEPTSPSPPSAVVLAVVVSPGVSAYLAETLRGLAMQRTAPDAVLVVDVTAAQDPGHARTSALRTLAQESGLALEKVRVTHAPEARSFGAGVRGGLRLLADQGSGGAELASARWIWLLHDDSAPEPAALDELLRGARSGPTVAITGAKQRDWFAPERLLELGVSVSRGGRRYLGFDDGELDQGQHDSRVDVYGVGTAGALVRTRVWNDLEGTDQALGPFGDGLDLSRRARLAGYRVIVAPRAVVRHARASYLGLRLGAGTAARARRRRTRAAASGPVRAAFLYGRLVESARWVVALACIPHRRLGAHPHGGPHRHEGVPARRRRGRCRRLGADPAPHRPPGPRSGHRQRTVSRERLAALAGHRRQVWRVGARPPPAVGSCPSRRVRASELEVGERAALATRRRWTAGILATVLLGVAALVFAPFLSVGALTGGALQPLTSDLGDVVGARPRSAGGPRPGTGTPGRRPLPLRAHGGDGARRRLRPDRGHGAGARRHPARGARGMGRLGRGHAVRAPAGLGHGRVGPGTAACSPSVRGGWAPSSPTLRCRGSHSGSRGRWVSSVATSWQVFRSLPRRSAPGSVAAAAGAGLVLAVAAAASPVLLTATVLLLPLLGLLAGRRRGMLVLVAIPPIALLTPLVLEAFSDVGAGSWRVLLADPGVLLASAPGPAYQALLMWPAGPVAWPVLAEPAAGLARSWRAASWSRAH